MIQVLILLFCPLQIDYPEVHAMKSGVRAGCNMMNLDRLPQYDPQDDIRMKRLNVDTTTCNDQVSVRALEDFLNDPQKQERF